MQPVRKLFFFLSLAILFAWLVVPIVIAASPLEFVNRKLVADYKVSRIWAVPLGIFLTLTGTLKARDSADNEARKAGCTTILAMLGFVFGLVSFWLSTCTTTNGRILFKNPSQHSVIRERETGCGATDSGKPSISIVSIRPLNHYFNIVRYVDTTTLDKKYWFRSK